MAKKAAKLIEWIGGTVAMPMYVTDEGEPYRPIAALWMTPDGLVLGLDTFGREARPGQAAQSFLSATRAPMVGRPHLPNRVRVSSPALARELGAAVPPGVEVVLAPTPEIDAMVDLLQKTRPDEPDGDETLLGPGMTPEAMASFFRTTARLYRAAPWKIVPGDTYLLEITIEALGVRGTVVSIIGGMDESYGLVCFESLADFHAFVAGAETIEEDKRPKIPAHLALNFDPGHATSPAVRKEIATHRWEVAGAHAFPSILVVDADIVGRPPTAAELTRTEAVASAVAWLVETEPGLSDAWDRPTPLTRTTTVKTGAGPFRVDLTTVTPRLPDEDDDDDAREREALVEDFAASPEAEAIGGTSGVAGPLLHYAHDYLGVTAAAMRPADLREVLFGIFPRKVACDHGDAADMVAELRAFFTYLRRARKLRNAEALLDVLGGNAVKRLERELSDPSNFGMAKSIMMAGAEAGFDTSTSEGVSAWVNEIQGKPLPAAPRSQAASKTDKNKRKAQRKAPRKNR